MKAVTPMRHPRGPAGLLVSLAALIAAVWVNACAADMELAGNDGSNCFSRSCPSGEVCTTEGVCVPEVAQPMTISFRLVPPEDSGLLEEHLVDLAVNGTANLGAVRFHHPVLTSGQVFFAGPDAGVFTGRVTFSLQESLVDQPIRTDVVVDEDGWYEVQLVPGTYQVTVRADGVPIPPFRRTFVVESGDHDYSIQLPNPDDHYFVSGTCVRRRPGSDEDIPIAGARVTLVSSAGVTLSTAIETDGEGNFSVTALPDEPEYMIRVGPGEMNSSVPDLLLGPVTIAETTNLGVLIVGEWADPVEVDGTVSGQNGVARPVGGTTVFFRHQLELGSYTQLSRADDENGNFSATLIPGDYHVVVAPPADEPYGADAFDETLYDGTVPPGSIQHPTLTEKPVLSGVVSGPSGSVIANASLSIEPTAYDVSLLALGPVSTITDVQGYYAVPVHPGTQRLVVTPQQGLGLAPFVATVDSVQQDSQLDVQLERASQLSGTILAPNGSPMPGVSVEGFVGYEEEMISFTVTETDTNGYFVVDLPRLGQ